MIGSKISPFDIAQIADILKGYDFDTRKLSGLSADDLRATQKKNMAALAEANKAAAIGYQALFTKQIAAYAAAVAQNDEPNNAALENIESLAKGAEKANVDAFEALVERVQEAIAEFQYLAKKSESQD